MQDLVGRAERGDVLTSRNKYTFGIIGRGFGGALGERRGGSVGEGESGT